MLLVVALSYLARYGVDALPISASVGTTVADALKTCPGSQQCRTVWDIVWSSLVVVFSCIWVSLHPNIPSPDYTKFAIIKRRAGLMLLALVAPELIALWAVRQYIAAKHIGRTFSGEYFPHMGQ